MSDDDPVLVTKVEYWRKHNGVWELLRIGETKAISPGVWSPPWPDDLPFEQDDIIGVRLSDLVIDQELDNFERNEMSETYGPYRGVVDSVHDGDTINIKLDVGFDLTVYARVRVYGINAPELNTEAGKKARSMAQQLLPVGSIVNVMSHGWDKYGGRIDGEITMSVPWLKDPNAYSILDFATAMIDSGNAVAVKYD